MKMTMYTAPTMVPRQQSKERVRSGRLGGKRLAMPRTYSGKGRAMARRSLDPCDNSNDSGLGASGTQTTTSSRPTPRCLPLINRIPSNAPVTLTSQLQASSRYMDISLSIVCQPEQQHRARYQTEGSRGAVKDRSGNGFPVVQLTGYNKPATLQVFIGSDQGKVAPHMFYQACKVSGKNSTPCAEKKIDGTIVIELQLEPAKEMQGTCDCVGILKERNVDVEHRFPDQLGSRAKKKSTRCRMVFRTTITHPDGIQETLQVCSQPIVCTQPPGIPEISKKSLTSCPASGGLELFIIGKNFLKDTLVVFQLEDEYRGNRWEQTVVPDKEFLQQTHLICVVPQFMHPDITEPVTVRLYVVSSGKTSEPHQFVYTPVNGAMPSVRIDAGQTTVATTVLQPFLTKMMPPPGTNMVPLSQRRLSAASITNTDSLSPPMRCMTTLKQEFIDENSQNSVMDASELHHRFRQISESSLDVHQGDSNMSMINENSMDMIRSHGNPIMHSGMTNENSNISIVNENSMEMMTTNSRSIDTIEDGSNHYSPQRSPEVMDLRRKMPMATVADLLNTKEPSMATLQSFGVMDHSGLPLPAQSAQSIENFLTNIETKPAVMQTSTTEIPSSFMPTEMLTPATEAKSEIMQQEPPRRDNPVENSLMASSLTSRLNVLVSCNGPPKEDNNVLLSQDVMMPPMINTNLTPPMSQTALSTPTSNISPDVILNSQISPSLMCRSNQDTLLPPTNLAPPVNVAPNLLTTANSNLLSVSEPENAIILSAAADLLETQKMLTSTATPEVIPTMSQLQTNSGTIGNNFFTTTADNATLTMDTLTKSIGQQQAQQQRQTQQQSIKKEEELRMVPPSLVSMSENDLINIINPSCFGQGNNNAMH